MYLPRIIPVLLLKGKGLVKTVKFKNPTYIGDPINAVRIFNELEADELVFLDIIASKQGRTIDLQFVKDIGDEAFMPFAVGGGIKSLNTVEEVLRNGAEKVVLNSVAVKEPDLIYRAASVFGSQSIVVAIDVKKNIFGDRKVYIEDGTQRCNASILERVKAAEGRGAGEIIIQSIDRDGTMSGYDLELIREVSETVSIPVIALGGAGCKEHLKDAIEAGKASAAAAGSMFVFHGPRKGVLVNYPAKDEIAQLFGEERKSDG